MTSPSTQDHILVEDWGRMDYLEAWKRQEAVFQEQLSRKRKGLPTSSRLILVEHPHVYTLGKSGNQANLLLTPELLEKTGAPFYRINRGGDITYHGPGQIVGYPILDLDVFRLTLKKYIDRVEKIIIRFLKKEYCLEAHHSPGATGVWLGEEGNERKICAIGTRASRNITMHGFALNVNTDLSYFRYIHPCGFTDRSVTSIQKEMGQAMDMEEVKKRLASFIVSGFKA